MLNEFVIVGRIANEVEIKEENGEKKGIISLAVSRDRKNEKGTYDTDFIDCIICNNLAMNTAEYCRKGDIVGVRGRIQTKKENGKYNIEFMAKKVTFLSSKKNEDRKEESEEV